MTEPQDVTLLYEEHLLLGATMGSREDLDLALPLAYPGSGTLSPSSDDTLLFDLTGLPYALLSGSEAQSIAEMCFAGPLLNVGECAFEATLFGDGSLVGVPLVLRTGEHEYCLLDLTAANDACMEWALALTHMSQGGERLFPGSSLEDATEFLLPLLLWGNEAAYVLNDYISDGNSLPKRGEVVSAKLDSIPALLASPDHLEDAYLVLVPLSYARVLWRSLLSFTCVQPAGLDDLRRELKESLSWHEMIDDPKGVTASALTAHQLIRANGQFVGMRGLLEG